MPGVREGTRTGVRATPGRSVLQAGHREFTGHEAIPDVGLINMNGRVYDPQLGRFPFARSTRSVCCESAELQSVLLCPQ